MKDPNYKNYSDLTLDELEQLVQELELMSVKALKQKKKSLISSLRTMAQKKIYTPR